MDEAINEEQIAFFFREFVVANSISDPFSIGTNS